MLAAARRQRAIAGALRLRPSLKMLEKFRSLADERGMSLSARSPSPTIGPALMGRRHFCRTPYTGAFITSPGGSATNTHCIAFRPRQRGFDAAATPDACLRDAVRHRRRNASPKQLQRRQGMRLYQRLLQDAYAHRWAIDRAR